MANAKQKLIALCMQFLQTVTCQQFIELLHNYNSHCHGTPILL